MAETYLLWTDFETTGVDHDTLEVLEAATMLTHGAGAPIEEAHSRVFTDTHDAYFSLPDDHPVVALHKESKLHDDLVQMRDRAPYIERYSYPELENEVLDRIAELGIEDEDTIHIAGSGVAQFDLRIVQERMPRLGERLHYAPIDVGIMRRMLIMSNVELPRDEWPFCSPSHRAQGDILQHYASYVYYQRLLSGAPVPENPWSSPLER